MGRGVLGIRIANRNFDVSCGLRVGSAKNQTPTPTTEDPFDSPAATGSLRAGYEDAEKSGQFGYYENFQQIASAQ